MISKLNKCSGDCFKTFNWTEKIKLKQIRFKFPFKSLAKWRNDLNKKMNYNKLLQTILDESGYSEMIKNKKDLENENRLENIKEL